MIRPMIVSIALLVVSSLAGVSASEIPTTTYEGTVLVRTDAHGRVAVVLDADGDGYADRLFVFDPYEMLPQGLAEREARATVFASARELRVVSSDGSVALQLYPTSPADGAASTIQIGHHVVAHGKALVEIRLPRGAARLGAVDADGVVTVDGATGLPCTPSDLGCQAGGEGATSCQMSCGGGGLTTPLFGGNVIGQSCGVSCDIARRYYPCCKCGAGGAECRCKSSTQSLDCGDAKGDALTPVEN